MTHLALILATAPQCAPLPDPHAEGGTWTMIVVPPTDGELMGCMVASGSGYMAVPVGELN